MGLWICGTLMGIKSLIRYIYSTSSPPKHSNSNFAITPTFTYRWNIHGCVDGHRRLITYLRSADKHRADTVPRLLFSRLWISTIHSLQVFPVTCFCCVYTFSMCVCVCVQIILTVLYLDRVVFFGHVCSPELRIKDLRSDSGRSTLYYAVLFVIRRS